MTDGRVWQQSTVLLAVALAFADASIVVLALPQIVDRLHTSISHVTWVIMAYNLALIVSAAAVIPFARRVASTPAVVAGLALFGLASIGCGLSDSMSALVPFRCLQGLGGGLLLAASLPLVMSSARSTRAGLNAWGIAGAIGMAVGPAVGGILTQVFDWRSIFLAQAPVAALAIVLVFVVRVRASPPTDAHESHTSEQAVLVSNASLTMLSAGLIAALFLSVLLLINAWRLTPIEAAVVVTSIPLAAAVATRVTRGRPPLRLAAVGATLVTVGLLTASLVTHRELFLVTAALVIVGAGLGSAFPSLTAIALGGVGPPAARAAKTVAARDGGILLGLLILTPVFVNQLHHAPTEAKSAAAIAVFAAPIPVRTDLALVPGLEAAYRRAPQGQLPNFGPAFARAGAHATRRERAALVDLHRQLDAIVEHDVTAAFKLPLRYGAIFAFAVLPLLGLQLLSNPRRRSRPTEC